MGITLLDTLPLARRFYTSINSPSGICVYHSATWPFRDESKLLPYVPTFFYRLSFVFKSENSFGKEKDRSFWELA